MSDPQTPPPFNPSASASRGSGDIGEPDQSRLDGRERKLDSRVVLAWRLGSGIRLLFPLGAAGFAAWMVLPDLRTEVVIALAILWVSWVAWYPKARFRRWRWSVSDLALELRRGVLIHRHDAVPYFRIQQIDIAQGPFDRMLGLAELTVTTASASGSASLPGLPASEAPRVRRELLRRATEALGDRTDAARDAV